MKNLSEADLQKPTKLYGRDTTGLGVAYHLIADMHEHLGQAIAYARVNNIVPPWTAAAKPAASTAVGARHAVPGVRAWHSTRNSRCART